MTDNTNNNPSNEVAMVIGQQFLEISTLKAYVRQLEEKIKEYESDNKKENKTDGKA